MKSTSDGCGFWLAPSHTYLTHLLVHWRQTYKINLGYGNHSSLSHTILNGLIDLKVALTLEHLQQITSCLLQLLNNIESRLQHH